MNKLQKKKCKIQLSRYNKTEHCATCEKNIDLATRVKVKRMLDDIG